MATFQFHLFGGRPITVDVEARSIAELAETMATERFIIGTNVQPNEDGVLPSVLMATTRIQCVVETGD